MLHDPENCCICKKSAIEGQMLFCSNPDHDEAAFHFSCDEDLLTMPVDTSSSLCPNCKKAQAEEQQQQQSLTCCICKEKAIDGQVLFCSNPEHKEAAFHFSCDEDLTVMPFNTVVALCPNCKKTQDKGERQALTCCVCNKKAVEGEMLFCENSGHENAVFHWSCDKTLTTMPGNILTALCPVCKKALGGEQ